MAVAYSVCSVKPVFVQTHLYLYTDIYLVVISLIRNVELFFSFLNSFPTSVAMVTSDLCVCRCAVFMLNICCDLLYMCVSEKGCSLLLSHNGPFTAFIPLLKTPLTVGGQTYVCLSVCLFLSTFHFYDLLSVPQHIHRCESGLFQNSEQLCSEFETKLQHMVRFELLNILSGFYKASACSR